MEQQGILFESERALDIFRENGFYIEGKIVHFKEDDVRKALQLVPERFVIRGSDRKNDVEVG
ncbi:hypothetical protein EAI89_23125 [Eubacterium sp. am_0171]|nr:hypothetical protein [Eubacterium sp. BIOML-A1]MSD08883.1 hypothetical protein [Eubacterium sp. BIOML-A2]RYT09686.1 hypothetical protein EAI89_23125 [Eubacterium sp. am_0171]